MIKETIKIINTLTKTFNHNEKILMLSSSLVCLSFTILNFFENNRGIIKILVYTSVIDIIQINVILFAIITCIASD